MTVPASGPLVAAELPQAAGIKACCARLYESDWARWLLGASFHPGGLALTQRLGVLLGLRPGQRVLDVAAGPGTSAIFLAQRFGCDVLGIEYGAAAVAQANTAARAAGLVDRVRFERGDAEALPVDSSAFDAVLCECAFCTFPDRAAAAREFARCLRPGGRVGLSDLTRAGELPDGLNTLLAWIACIRAAQPIEVYQADLENAGLELTQAERHDEALLAMIDTVRKRLMGAELMVRLKGLELPGADFGQARTLARLAAESAQDGRLGYALLVASKA
jgi:arsenite methyltransferase